MAHLMLHQQTPAVTIEGQGAGPQGTNAIAGSSSIRWSSLILQLASRSGWTWLASGATRRLRFRASSWTAIAPPRLPLSCDQNTSAKQLVDL